MFQSAGPLDGGQVVGVRSSAANKDREDESDCHYGAVLFHGIIPLPSA